MKYLKGYDIFTTPSTRSSVKSSKVPSNMSSDTIISEINTISKSLKNSIFKIEENSLIKRKWTNITFNDLDNETINFMWNTYTSEYKRLGMDLSVDNIEQFKRKYKTLMLIDLDTDPNPDAFIIYSERHNGNKINLLWSDGAKESKDFLVKKMIELLKEIGWWIEASLKIEDILKQSSINYIESEDVIKQLIDKNVIYLSDGYYSRKLTMVNKWITKRIYGNPVNI